MIETDSLPPQDARTESAHQIQATIRHVARRQQWLWSAAVMVTLLLTLGIASFAFPGLLAQADPSYSLNLSQAVRGLVGLVLLFNVYTVYQQLQIHRVQGKLSEQVAALDRMEARTEEVYKLAILDPLTGLYNRRCGEQRLQAEVSRSERHGLPLTVIMLDLNRLKYFNDTFGHAAGDELIKHFAARINKAIRGSDLAVRLGGDEFLLLLPECKPAEVRHVLGRLSGMSMELKGVTTPIAFSAGWANHIPGESPDELLKRADDALYANKRSLGKRAEGLPGEVEAKGK
jgi:diguanylate cyclase (GGDEF)-like protein